MALLQSMIAQQMQSMQDMFESKFNQIQEANKQQFNQAIEEHLSSSSKTKNETIPSGIMRENPSPAPKQKLKVQRNYETSDNMTTVKPGDLYIS